MNEKRDTDLAPLKNPPLTMWHLQKKLCAIGANKQTTETMLIRVSKIGGKDHYITGICISPDGLYIRLTTSIGEIESDASTDEKENPSK